MKKLLSLTLFFLLFSFIIPLSSCVYSNGGLGRDVEEERNIGNFNGIKVSSGIDISLTQGNKTKLVIRADEDLIDDVNSDVRGGILELSVDRKWFRSGHVEAFITFTDINMIHASAGSDVISDDFLKFNEIQLEASSGSDIKLELEAMEVDIRTSSGSDATLSGSCRDFTARASSGSDIDAYDFEVENAILDLSSGSDVKIWVTGSLEVEASSGSDVNYRGDPKVLNINASGGSDVKKR